jgi:anti-sigma regulatory factor (Ser/Thr protein kinase)
MTADQPALVHQVLFYDSEEELITTALPFLREGIDADDVVLAVAPPPKIGALRDALGSDAPNVQFLDANEIYHHPVRTLAAYNNILQSHAPRKVRGIGELDWRGLAQHEITEWGRYEAVMNVVFAASGAQAICSYDTRNASLQALDAARRTHTDVLGRHGTAGSYTDPRVFAAGLDRSPLPAPPPHADVQRIESQNLSDLRSFVTERAGGHDLAPTTLNNLLIAVTETATNALTHGTPPVTLHLWTTADHIICEISDHGHWQPDPLLGLLPPTTAPPRFGLWGVRMLTDTVQIRTCQPGTAIRLHTRLLPSRP